MNLKNTTSIKPIYVVANERSMVQTAHLRLIPLGETRKIAKIAQKSTQNMPGVQMRALARKLAQMSANAYLLLHLHLLLHLLLL